MLEVKEIDVAYGGAKVVHGVNLGLHRGEMVFVVGRNGAGKTTLLKTIAGLLKPIKGTIVFEGKEIQGLSAERIARLGFRFVAQEKKVFSALTVRSNIELAAYGAGENPETALGKAVDLYPDLRKFMNLHAGGLSGGQREMLLIGRALSVNPKVVLIDEPTEGLAAIVIKDIFRILNGMKENLSAIIVEQNLSVVSRLADRVYVMKEGKIIRELTEKAEISNSTELETYL
ncbi:MAG: ABC transporter ATP-binding protein [Deltaproteobacteria bacterium RBG_16_49_23]|nr:MAG: ABC transporter ATP-binding protein [Deltaproteobacteria bacterium RBG_16_49_23]